jgi:membrane-bound ClpP family serine protease
MPNWSEIILEIQEEQQNNPNVNALDTIRRKYLRKVSEITGRNTIAYYSGWLQKPQAVDTAINDKDKAGFMLVINKLDRKSGLDLILHTPGGDIAATESLVDYLYAMFGKNIRVIVPQISMSAGTMIAFASKEIVMGKHSNLGPIDPQMGGLACQAVLDEFEQAKNDIRINPHAATLWQMIIGKYHPTFLGACKQAIEWSEKMVSEWLEKNMCNGDKKKVRRIVDTFASHAIQKSHARHISKKECEEVGLNIYSLESNQDLQDAVLTTHHAFMHTFNNTYCVKIIENQNGVAYIEQAALQKNK